MSKRNNPVVHSKQRAILTDTLPFDVPPTFSNRGFYSFLVKHQVEIENGEFRWKAGKHAVSLAIHILFGVNKSSLNRQKSLIRWGKPFKYSYVNESSLMMRTIPFNFRISHKDDGRTLSVAHPRNQFAIANFYYVYGSLITYYTSLSSFSIRYPTTVASAKHFDDTIPNAKFEGIPKGVERDAREYENFGSYFVYSKHRLIYKFFESDAYIRCEKMYNAMVQIDINKCFDSIYTHSLPWATLGKSQTKQRIKKSSATFGGMFDKAMQQLNYGETNGILIGPEFSRIFAEIVLQSLDIKLEYSLSNELGLTHGMDYEIFRYMDDYFIFYRDTSLKGKLIEATQEVLKEMKLSVNMSKTQSYTKPIVSELTIAKQKILTLLNTEFSIKVQDDTSGTTHPAAKVIRRIACNVVLSRLIVSYKAIVNDPNVEFANVLNFTFSIIEKKVECLFSRCKDLNDDELKENQMNVVNILNDTFSFIFFGYLSSASVSRTVIVCRLISTSINFLRKNKFSYEAKHLLFQNFHDNIRIALNKTPMGPHKEVESLYLLISLSSIGSEYCLPVDMITRHFRIDFDDKTKIFKRDTYLSHFSITVLLSYMKRMRRYTALRRFIERHVIEKVSHSKAQCHFDAEVCMLFLDLIVCPYVSSHTKRELSKFFCLTKDEFELVRDVNDYWFTAWEHKFNLTKALDSKRRSDVYS